MTRTFNCCFRIIDAAKVKMLHLIEYFMKNKSQNFQKMQKQYFTLLTLEQYYMQEKL